MIIEEINRRFLGSRGEVPCMSATWPTASRSKDDRPMASLAVVGSHSKSTRPAQLHTDI
ncbi:MAG: hypothetical protein ACLVJ6_02750 [Merdibacter sp.]